MGMQIEQNNGKIAKNSVFLYLRLAIVMIVNLYTTRVVLEVLGILDYGVYNVVCGFVSMFGVLNTSMSDGIQRFYNYELGKSGEQGLNNVYNTSVYIQSALAVVLVLLLETIGLWYLNAKMDVPADRIVAANYVFQFSIISLVFVILQVPYRAAILAYERMDFYAVVSVIDVFIKLLVVIIIPYLRGDSLITYGLLLALVGVLNFVFYYGYCKRKFIHIKFCKIFDKHLFKTMFSFSGWNLFGTFAYMVKGQGINILLNAFFGAIVNAANGIATQVLVAIQLFTTNLTLAFKPQITQSYAKGDYIRVESLMFSMSKISFLLVSILFLPIMIDVEYILKLWLGANVPTYTAIFTRLVIITMMISILNTPITQVIHATGKMRKYQLITSLIICSILPISYLGLKLGLAAEFVFYIGIVITIINQIVSVWILSTIFSYNVFMYVRKVVFFCILIIPIPLFASICILNHFSESIIRFIIIFIASAILMCANSIALLSRTEKNMLYQMVNKVLKR